MTLPLVSICLPTLNARPFLEPRMASILAQTQQDWELIACDSFSTDGTWEFLQEFRDDPRVHLHQVPREGLYAGWNECLVRAKGKYIHIATADDVEAPDFQSTLLALLEPHPDALLAYCNYREIGENGAELGGPPYFRSCHFQEPDSPVRRPAAAELLHSIALWAPWVTLSSVLFRRDLLDHTELFPTTMKGCGDVLWACRACLTTDCLYAPATLSDWRRHGAQITSSAPTAVPDIANAKIIHQHVRQFLHERAAELPAVWKTVPNWAERLLTLRLQLVREHGGLDRRTLRTSPSQVLRAVSWFARNDPAFLMRRLRSGFSWNAPEFSQGAPDLQQSLQKLCEEFSVPPQSPLTSAAH